MSEVVPDPMEGEQTWPLEEELKEGSNGYTVYAYCNLEHIHIYYMYTHTCRKYMYIWGSFILHIYTCIHAHISFVCV